MMVFSEGGRGDGNYAPEVLAAAEIAARELISGGELKIKKFPVGNKAGELCVSSDPKLVVGSKIISVDGRDFYIGFAVSEES